jgi:DNA-binding GntR family transcriptional regulator
MAIIDGKEFVTAAEIADGLPYSSTQVGAALRRLQAEDLVEKHNTRQWRILEGSA